jgi:4-hydroxy-4-methyl-2-oxoglutarate aldolase
VTATADELDALARWDTPALSNALDSLRLRSHSTGYTDGSVTRLTGDAPMVGTAITAKMAAREPGEDGIPVARLHELVAGVDGPVVVVLEDVDVPAGAGAFLGEVNGSLLAALHIRGFVTNGRVRDIDELRTLAFPVYAHGLCVARSYMRLVEVGAPVVVAGLAVQSGDVLHGDEHGVLHVPAAALPAIIEKAEQIRDEEQAVVTWSRSTEFTVEGLLALRRVRH